ncbi:lipoate--protein ligase [Aggregatilinea lenta]|uniref:lipoate--protein ligase n=1 Tax=Aggregatilinea lenta TaxID=913108 RepID=UPI000E5A8873|nr:lipoate--protein ligase [Aggregatilinea lenta]
MIYMETKSLDPTWNLAFEEYCLTELTQYPEIMLLWQNENAIIVGRYQNAEKEVNVEAAQALGTRVVRRSTGGGTVYHDLGNLNYSFILSVDDPKSADLSVVAKPVVNALRRLGVPAEIQGRNDIVVDGKKISGTAQRFTRGRLLHHGTLLFDSDLSVLQSVLNVDATKIASKGIASVKSRVTNIKPYLPPDSSADIYAFWQALLAAFAEEQEIVRHTLSEQDLEQIKHLQQTKYRTWDWSTASAPAFEYVNSKRFPGGKLDICLDVKGGTIAECVISGDFMGLVSLDGLVSNLIGVKYHPADVLAALKLLDLSLFLGSITADDVVQAMFEGTLLAVDPAEPED